jgi:hypothetical protein
LEDQVIVGENPDIEAGAADQGDEACAFQPEGLQRGGSHRPPVRPFLLWLWAYRSASATAPRVRHWRSADRSDRKRGTFTDHHCLASGRWFQATVVATAPAFTQELLHEH